MEQETMLEFINRKYDDCDPKLITELGEASSFSELYALREKYGLRNTVGALYALARYEGFDTDIFDKAEVEDQPVMFFSENLHDIFERYLVNREALIQLQNENVSKKGN